MSTALILFAHGARDPEWAYPLRRVREAILLLHPGVRVELAFLEFMAPDLTTCVNGLIDEACTKVVVLPMFIAQGGHLKRDVPALIEKLRKTGKNAEILLLPAIGESDTVIQAMAASALTSAGL